MFFIDGQLQDSWGDAEKWYMDGPFHPEEAGSNRGWQYDLVPKTVYNQSLTFLREYVNQEYGSRFIDLDTERQKSVVSALQNENIPAFRTISSSEFFDMLHSNVLEGMFSDPIYGGNRNMVGWKMKEFPGTPGGLGSYRARIEEGQFIHLPPTALNGQDLGPDPGPGYPESTEESGNETESINRTDEGRE